MMDERRLQRLFRIINANPLENPLFPFRRLNALPWFKPKPVGASILFIDMSASVWSKIDDTAVWQENIYTLHSRASRIVRTCYGRVSKFIGDCVMAVFTGQDHQAHALWCAAALLETFGLLKDYFEPDMDSTLWRFPVTIGLASGSVYFLYPGDPFGTPVDLAARLQSLATPSSGIVFAGTVEEAGEAAGAHPLSSFLGERQTVSVKSFGDVVIVKMSRPKAS